MEVDIRSLARRVREEWSARGLAGPPPKLDEMPEAVRNDLPEEFLAFLGEAGLPDDEDMDGKYFTFWPPEKWIVSRVAGDTLLVFADYLIDSHRFGLWVSGEHRGAVSLVFDEPEPPLAGFAQFLQMYLDDDPALLG